MLQDCIEVFEKQLKVSKDKLIIDNYIPADGTYIIVSLIDGEFSIKEFFNIKYDKKLDNLEGRANIYFEDVCNYDYNSKLIDMNKPIDRKKIIHSNNYLSFFIKKESLSNGKLTQDIIDNYYKILSNPYLKYDKPKAKEIYKYIESDLEDIDQDLLNKIKEWIKLNIFNLEKLGIKIIGKDYLKVFFDLPIEKYQNEGRRYLIPNIYNSNDFNEKFEGTLYGLPNDNINLNAKKPYLENKTRKVKVPYLVDEKQVLLQKKFFDYLMVQCSKGNVNIYIDKDKVRSYKNGEMPDSDFNGMYMRIKKGKEVEIHSYDIVTSYKFKLDKPFKFLNVLELSEKVALDENYGVYNDKKMFQEIINNTLFSKYLVNNYYTEPKDISIKDNIIKRNLLISRDSIFNFLYKGNQNGLGSILNKVSLDLIKNCINNGYITKASHQYNLKCSLENYFKGGNNMGDILHEVKSSLREKINSEDTKSFSSDKEYYFAVGQFINYLLSKSKGKNKPHSLVNPFINAKSNTVIKDKLRNLYKRYNYDIDMYNKRVKNIYAMIVSYEPETKVDQDMIIAGYLHNNLIYESNKGETKYE